jgi:hypothetical protein
MGKELTQRDAKSYYRSIIVELPTRRANQMRTRRTKLIVGSVLVCLIALVLSSLAVEMKAKLPGDQLPKISITAEQAIESIKTAIAAKAGNVRGIELENEDGKIICEVKILAAGGKVYEVEIDVTTNTVVEVEEDDDNDEDDKY